MNFFDGVVRLYQEPSLPSQRRHLGIQLALIYNIQPHWERVWPTYSTLNFTELKIIATNLDILSMEPTISWKIELAKRKNIYSWSDGMSLTLLILTWFLKRTNFRNWRLYTIGLLLSGVLTRTIVPFMASSNKHLTYYEHFKWNYTISAWRLYKAKRKADKHKSKVIGQELYQNLRDLTRAFVKHSKKLMVMDPNLELISIFI